MERPKSSAPKLSNPQSKEAVSDFGDPSNEDFYVSNENHDLVYDFNDEYI